MRLAKSWRDYPALLETLTPENFISVVKRLCETDLFFLMRYAMEKPFMDNDWWFSRCREVQVEPNGYLDLWAREHGKDLADDTPMLTVNRGWITHGQIAVGDFVYSPNGKPVKVIALSEKYTKSDCYKITMKDGAAIVCGAGHLWRVRKKHRNRIGDWREGKREVSHADVVLNTKDIYSMASSKKIIDIGCCSALDMPKAKQTIDPYILGCWLGDGNSDSARFTTSIIDFAHFEKEFKRAGHSITVYDKKNNCLAFSIDAYDKKRFCSRGHDKYVVGTYRLQCNACRALWANGKVAPPPTQDGMPYRLRSMGLMRGNKKFIPENYMNASINQRMEILRGLMDTDGTCDTRGTATFVNMNKELARQCYELASGLGLKPRFAKYNAKLNGRIVGDCYKVTMQSHKHIPIFKLKRKADRALNKSKYVHSRYIKKVEKVESVPTRCIQVDNPNGLYLAGHSLLPTHNSSIITIGLTIFDILNDPEITVGIFSHTGAIAKSFLRTIKREFENNQLLKKCFPDILYNDPAGESQKWSEDAGLIVKRKGNPPEATVEACGLVDGMPTGRHFQLRVYDDCVTSASVSTPDQMRKVIDALDMSNNLGKRGGVRRMIGTRYKLGDAYEEYINRGIVKPRIYAATDNGRVDGAPRLFSQDEWENKIAEMSSAIISSQMLQNPLAEDSVIVQPDWIKLWPSDKELPYFEMVFLSLDGAFSAKSTADDSCLGALGVFKATEGSSKYSVMIVDNWMEKVPYPELRDEVIRQFGNKFGVNEKSVDGIIIEDKASGSALIPELRRAGMPVYPYNPGSLDKTARANLISHLIRDGYVWMPESGKRKGYPMSWLSKGWEQLMYFPNVKHDDFVDMLVQALSTLDKMGFLRGKVAEPRHVTYWEKIRTGSYSGDMVNRGYQA